MLRKPQIMVAKATDEEMINEIAANLKENSQLIDRILDDAKSVDKGVEQLTAIIKLHENLE